MYQIVTGPIDVASVTAAVTRPDTGDTVTQRWPIEKVAIVHRIGVVPLGEASVVIAVSAGHRHAAFEACHFAIDRLKEVVPIWKKEHFEGGEIWIGSQTGTPSEPILNKA